METEGVSLQETQRNLEELFSKNQLIPVLRDQFAELTDDPFTIDVLVQIYLHKQADVPTMVGLFSPKWGEPEEVGNMLLAVCEEDFMDYDINTDRFSVVYEITEDVEDMLARYQYPLPMVVRPKKVTKNFGTCGYNYNKSSMVLNGSDVFRDEDLCLDHINRLNSVPLSINMRVVKSEQGQKLKPTRKQGEGWKDFQKRVKQYEVFYDTSIDVMEGLMALSSEIFLTHKYDRRGRTYACGYHVSSQGTPYNKAVLELAKKEVING